jgi:hypothetical protein
MSEVAHMKSFVSAIILSAVFVVGGCSNTVSSEAPNCQSRCPTDCWDAGCNSYRAVWVEDVQGHGSWECLKTRHGSSTCDAFALDGNLNIQGSAPQGAGAR